MQDVVEATARRLRLAAALFLATLAVFAVAAPGASAEQCSTSGPRVCVNVVSDPAPPVTVSPSTAAFPTFISYAVSISNEGTNTATHVTLSDALPVGSTFVSASPSLGTCANITGAVECSFGPLKSGATVTATILVNAPGSSGTVTNTATVSFDEGFSDSPFPDPKQDKVTASAVTDVEGDVGTAKSLVPSGQAVGLDTDPTHADVATPQDKNIGQARVPASVHAPFIATLEEVTARFQCPMKVICRDGAWLHADIPGTFEPDPLVFTIHWNRGLVPKQQTTDNLAVLHTDCIVACPKKPVIEVISKRCSSPDPAPSELPCLSDVVATDTEFKATLHSKTNGYMR
jgi:uncharacterized repeat protein (TIGR01451 family)